MALTTTSYWRFLQRHRPAWVRLLRGLRLLATATAKLPRQPRRSLAVLRGLATAIRQPIQAIPGDPMPARPDPPQSEPGTLAAGAAADPREVER